MSLTAISGPVAQQFVECELCDTRPAQHFCNTCPGTLCEICKADHNKKKMFQTHEIIPLVPSRKQISRFCSDHRTKRCKFYCKLCKEPACSKCFTEKHKGHSNEKLSTSKFHEEQMMKLIQCIDRIGKFIIPAHEDILTETNTRHAGVLQCTEEIGSLVQKHTEDIIRVLRSTESKIFSALVSNKNQALFSIQSDKSVIQERIARLNEIKNLLQEMHITNTVDDTLLKQHISRIEEMAILPEMTTVTPSKFEPGELDKLTIKKQIGNLTLFGLSKTQRLQIYDPVCPQPFVRSDIMLIKKPVRKAKLKIDVENQHEIKCINTSAAVVSGNDNKIRIVDICGKNRKIGTHLSLDEWPRGIGLIKHNDIIYTDKLNRKVMHVSMIGDISTLFTLRTDYFPVGLAVTQSGNILVGLILKADFMEKGQRGKVVEYTASGEIVKEFIKDGDKELFKRPIYVTKNLADDDIMVSDEVKKTLIVLNGKGSLKFEYNGKALSRSSKFEPGQITCDSLCQILIADHSLGAIHVISQDGNPLRLLLSDELDRPVGICFDGDDSIWIAEWESQKIKIYKYLE